MKSLNLSNPTPTAQKGQLRTREGPDLPQVTQETQGLTSQCRPPPTAPSQASPGKVRTPPHLRQASDFLHSDPLPCWRVLCQRQRHEAAHRQCVSAAAMGQRPLSAHQCPCQQASECQGEAGPGQRYWGPSSSGLVSQQRRPRHVPELLPVPNFLLSGACACVCAHTDIIHILPTGGSWQPQKTLFPLEEVQP